jgi:hypothetical protein
MVGDPARALPIRARLPAGQMTVGADILGVWRSPRVVVERRAAGSRTSRFLALC